MGGQDVKKILELEEEFLKKLDKLLNNVERCRTMDNKELVKYLVNNAIEREYYNSSDNFIGVLNKNPKLAKEYKEYGNIREDILKKLYEVLPEEFHEMLDKLENTDNIIAGIEGKAMFKEGLILGVTELNYLSKVGIEIAFI